MLPSPTLYGTVDAPKAEESPVRPPAAVWGHPALWIAALCVVVFAFQGSRSLWEPDEGRYAAVAWEMVATGDWLTPHLNPEVPHFTKPPLTYWAIAGAIRWLGPVDWAVRLPNALAFIATVLLCWRLGRRLTPRSAALPAIVQATSLAPFMAANVVTTDTLLALWETVAVFGFVADQWDTPRPRWGRPLMWLGFGLAFLTKGPPALLPLLAIAAFLVSQHGMRGLARLWSPIGWLLFAVVGCGWYVLVIHRRPDLLTYFLGDEIAGRIAGEHGRHSGWRGPLEVYLPTLLLGTLPWSPLLLWRRRRRPLLRPWPLEERFLALWIGLPLAVFVLAGSRLPLYVLPLFVPLSLAIARHLEMPWPLQRLQLGLLLAAVLSLVGLKAAVATLPGQVDTRALAKSLAPFHPSEVVFVDRDPKWSVSYYLQCTVERADFQSRIWNETAYRPLSESLAHELDEREEGSVFLVTPQEVEAFLAVLAEHHWMASRAGSFDGMEMLTTQPVQGDVARSGYRQLASAPPEEPGHQDHGGGRDHAELPGQVPGNPLRPGERVEEALQKGVVAPMEDHSGPDTARPEAQPGEDEAGGDRHQGEGDQAEGG